MENRRDKRFGERASALLKDKSQAQETAPLGAVVAYTHDISVSGASLSCEMNFPVGYVIRIAMELGSEEPPFEVDGEVVWSRESREGKRFDIGVEFLHQIPDTILSLLKHFYGKKGDIPSSVS